MIVGGLNFVFLYTDHPYVMSEPPRRSTRLANIPKAARVANIQRQTGPQRTRIAAAWKTPPARPIQPAEQAITANNSSLNTIQPVASKIHENLKTAWVVNPKLEMCFAFDYISPARQFKRGVPYDESMNFPEPGDTPPDDLTETDSGEAIGWIPYMSPSYKYVPPILCTHRFHPYLTP